MNEIGEIIQTKKLYILTTLSKLGDIHTSALFNKILCGQVSTGNELKRIKEYLWDCLHKVCWKDVDDVYRDLFGYLTALVVVQQIDELAGAPKEDLWCDLLSQCDLGLLLGSPLFMPVIHKVIAQIQLLRKKRPHGTIDEITTIKRPRVEGESTIRIRTRVALPPTIHSADSPLLLALDSLETPDMVTFYNRYFVKEEPLLLRGCMEDWGAMTKWGDLRYILEVGGHRTVPIETGASYLSPDSGSRLMTIRHFVDSYIRNTGTAISDDCNATQQSSEMKIKDNKEHRDGVKDCIEQTAVERSGYDQKPMGYLAQHQLLKQIPELRADIDIPDYCALLLDKDEAEETAVPQESEEIMHDSNDVVSEEQEDVRVQMWFGPVGTLSPLHHDPYYNLLAQVVGYKYVRLYRQSESPKLYAMEGVMYNNSHVDLMLPDFTRHPLLPSAPYSEHMLGPGEMLFIPRHCWHLVQAIDYQTAEEWRRGRSEIRSSSIEAHCATAATSDAVDSTDVDSLHAKGILHTSIEDPEFSISVSLWWGRRIEKEH